MGKCVWRTVINNVHMYTNRTVLRISLGLGNFVFWVGNLFKIWQNLIVLIFNFWLYFFLNCILYFPNSAFKISQTALSSLVNFKENFWRHFFFLSNFCIFFFNFTTPYDLLEDWGSDGSRVIGALFKNFRVPLFYIYLS